MGDRPRRILDEMCRLYGKFASYLRRVLCKTRLIFPRINGPIIYLDVIIVSKKYMYALVRLKVIINCMYNGTTGMTVIKYRLD